MLLSQYPAWVLLSLSHIVSFSVSLFQCSYSFSRTLSPTVHRSLSLSLMISGSRVYVCNECLCDWTASGGRLLAPARTCHIRKRFFFSPGLLPVLGCSQGSLFRSRRSCNTSLIFTFPPFKVDMEALICFGFESELLIESWQSIVVGQSGNSLLWTRETSMSLDRSLNRKWLTFVLEDVTLLQPDLLNTPHAHTHTHKYTRSDSPTHTLHPVAAELD